MAYYFTSKNWFKNRPFELLIKKWAILMSIFWKELLKLQYKLRSVLLIAYHGFIVHHWFLCRFEISGQFLFCSCYITSMLILDCVDLCTEVVMKLLKFCFAPWKKKAYLWRLAPFRKQFKSITSFVYMFWENIRNYLDLVKPKRLT